MTKVPSKVWPQCVRLLDLPAYAHGGIVVERATTNTFDAVTISPNTPGCLYLATCMNGPKDWSPFGVVPKDWIFIMRIPSHVSVRLIATYKNIEGHQNRTEHTIMTPKTLEALYFAPF